MLGNGVPGIPPLYFAFILFILGQDGGAIDDGHQLLRFEKYGDLEIP